MTTYIFGLDVLGAQVSKKHKHVPRAGFVLKKTPAGKPTVALVLNKSKHSDASIKNARDAGKRAVSVGNKLNTTLTKLKSVPPGVAQAAVKAISAGKAALAHADSHEQLRKIDNARVEAGAKAVSKILSGARGDKLLGAVSTILGAYCEVLGAGTTANQEPSVAPPLVPGADYVPSGPKDDANVYSSDAKSSNVPLPLGFVVYDNSHELPKGSVGSYSRFYGNWSGMPLKGTNSGYEWNGSDGWYAQLAEDKTFNPSHAGSVQERSSISLKYNWGPLIGNPAGDWTKHMHYDVGGDKWFWYRDQAPPWATATDDKKRLDQAILDYKAQTATAAADTAAAAATDKLDKDTADALAKSQAAEDAATAARQAQELADAQKAADASAAQLESQKQQDTPTSDEDIPTEAAVTE